MTSVVIPVGYADCAIHWRRTGDLEDMLVTHGVATESTATVASDVALAWGFAWAATNIPIPVKLDRVVARVAVEGEAPLVQEASINIQGTASGNISPQNCATLLRKTTDHGGRRGRGRMYLPYVFENNVDDVGANSSVAISGLNTLCNDLLGALAGTSHGAATPMVLLHRPGNTATPLPYLVTGLFCDPIIATQRDRLRR